MGLDQYAYFRKPNQTERDSVHFHYWRKHDTLHGWMEILWREKIEAYKNKPIEDKFIDALDQTPIVTGGEFNVIELELTLEDLSKLENDIKDGHFLSTDVKRGKYLKFIREARKHIKKGMLVFYNSWW